MITCLDIGGSGIKGAVATSPAELEMIGRVPTPLDDFAAFVAAVEGVVAAGGTPPGSPVAIAITGVVDPETGIIRVANIPCIDGRRLAAELGRELRARSSSPTMPTASPSPRRRKAWGAAIGWCSAPSSAPGSAAGW